MTFQWSEENFIQSKIVKKAKVHFVIESDENRISFPGITSTCSKR